MLTLAGDAVAEGARVRPQVAGRPVTLLLGLQTFHPFAYCPSWGAVGILPTIAERIVAMRDPETRRRLVAEAQTPDPAMVQFLDPAKAFPLGDPPNYEPDPSTSIAARAAREGRDVYDLYYDLLMEDNGHALVMRPLLNYTDSNLDAVREMLLHPTSALRSRRRRCALRHHLRRVDADVHAHPLGPRP